MFRPLPIATVIVIAALTPAILRAEPVNVRVTASRQDTKISLKAQEKTTVVDVICPFGIDGAKLERAASQWPGATVLRLHLKGLESLEVASGPVTLLVSVPSTGEPVPRLSLRQNNAETALDKTSPFWTDVRLVGGKGKIPLEEGYFEIPLPRKLFESNPPSIQLRWIDFYRN